MEQLQFELLKEVELFNARLKPFYELIAVMVDISTDLGKFRIDEKEAVKYVHNIIVEFEPFFQSTIMGINMLKGRTDGEKNFDKLFQIVQDWADSGIVELTDNFYGNCRWLKANDRA